MTSPKANKPCQRRRHANYEAAMVALAVIKQQGFRVNSFAEKLVAKPCAVCHGWHLVRK